MKVYVSELPKSCEECPCYSYSEGFCNCEFWWQKYKEIKDVQEYTHLGCKQNERPNDCPLQSLADYTKQVRKEVCEEIRDKLKDMDFLAHETELGERINCFSKYKVLDILIRVEDQIQGEKK